MSAKESKAIARRETAEPYDRTGDLDVADETYAPDFVGHDPTLPEDLRALEAARRFAATMRGALADLTCTTEDRVAEGDKAVTRSLGPTAPAKRDGGLGPRCGQASGDNGHR